jgi:glycosyltransferase involved in cell wall biosynthesis
MVIGFLVPQKHAAPAEKLEILIKDPELRKSMGKAGRAKYEKEYTLDVFENRLKSILESVLDKK